MGVRIVVVANHRAGSAANLPTLAEFLSRPGVLLIQPESADALAGAVKQAAAGECDLLVVAGGDGSVHTVVNALAPDFRVPLGVLPLGTGNDFCRTLGVPLDLPGAVAALDRRQVKRVDVIRVEGGPSRFATNAITGGFSGLVAAAATGEMKAAWGPLAYLRAAVGTVAERQTYRLTLTLDDRPPLVLDSINLVVANARFAAGGVAVAPTADPTDGKLDVVVVLAGDFADLSVVSARVLAGDYHADELVRHFRARRVEVVSKPPLPVSVDGEQAEGERFVFEAVRRVLPVVVGPDFRRHVRGGVARLVGVLTAGLRLGLRLPGIYLGGLALAVAVTVLFGLLARGVLHDDWKEWDEAGLGWAAGFRTPRRTTVAGAITWLGDGWVAVLTVLLVAGFLAVRKRFLDTATLFAVLIGLLLLETAIKPAFDRARPEHGLIEVRGLSFPSGHALRGVGLTVCYAGLLLHAGRHWWRWLLAGLLVALGLLVAASRVYLGVHYPTDVLAGGLAALAWVTASLVARSAVHRRRREAILPGL